MISGNVQTKDERRRRWSLAIVLMVFLCSGHWAALSASAVGSSSALSTIERNEAGNGVGHAIECVIGGVLLATDRTRSDFEVICPTDVDEAQLAPTRVPSLDLLGDSSVVASGVRRALLQVYLI